jgi:hypothetical protein
MQISSTKKHKYRFKASKYRLRIGEKGHTWHISWLKDKQNMPIFNQSNTGFLSVTKDWHVTKHQT